MSFSRDPVLEEAAVSVLEYTEEEVKRKTIGQIRRELEKHGYFEQTETSNNNAPDVEENETNEKEEAADEIEDEEERISRAVSESKRSKSSTPTPVDHESDNEVFDRLKKKKDEYERERATKKSVSFRTETPSPASVHEKSSRSTERSESSADIFQDIERLQDLLEKKIEFTNQLEKDEDFSRSDLYEWNESIERIELELKDKVSRVRSNLDRKLESWKRKQKKIDEIRKFGLMDKKLEELWERKQRKTYESLKKLKKLSSTSRRQKSEDEEYQK